MKGIRWSTKSKKYLIEQQNRKEQAMMNMPTFVKSIFRVGEIVSIISGLFWDYRIIF